MKIFSVLFFAPILFGAQVFVGLDPSTPPSSILIQDGAVQANLMTFEVVAYGGDLIVGNFEFYFTGRGGGRLLSNIRLYDGPVILTTLEGGVERTANVLVSANTAKKFVLRGDFEGPVGGYVTPSLVGGMIYDVSHDHYLPFHYVVGNERTLGDPDYVPTSVPEVGTVGMFAIAGVLMALSRR